MKHTAKLELTSISILCIIGDLPEEREKEQEIFVDISAIFPAEEVVNSDSLDNGIDYVDLIQICREIAKNGKYRLIETLAHQIMLQLPNSFPSITSLVIKVKKPQPSIGVAFTSIEFSQDY